MFEKYEKLDQLKQDLLGLGFEERDDASDIVFPHSLYGDICFTDNGYRLNFISLPSINFTVFYYAPIPNDNIYEEVLSYAKLIVCNTDNLKDNHGHSWKVEYYE